ncbi:MAG: hypothetical protein IT376_21520 [Polyangiaceae bacterium]|nr:hypothetical protein [Polyangiaceae bacterium]
MRGVSLSAVAAAGDLRAGGRWSRAQRWKNELLFHAVRGGLGAADRLRPPALERVLAILARGVPHRALARRLAPALGARAAAEVARRWPLALARNLAASLALRDPGRAALDRVVVAPAAHAALESIRRSSRGAIVVGAHVGPFELVPAVFAELGHAPAIVVRESYDPRLDPLVDRHRVARGIRVIHRGHAGAPFRIARALRSGSPVGFLVDLARSVPGVPMRLAGLGTRVAVGPVGLSLRLEVPMFGVGLRRVGTVSHERGAASAAGASWELELTELRFTTESSGLEEVERFLGELVAADPAEWLGLTDADPLPALPRDP